MRDVEIEPSRFDGRNECRLSERPFGDNQRGRLQPQIAPRDEPHQAASHDGGDLVSFEMEALSAFALIGR